MISVTILTKDSEATLFSVLDSVRLFKEVIILDTGSKDMTIEIANGFSNVKVRTSPFIGFGPLHNLAANYAAFPWILSLDSDEILTEALIREILALKLDSDSLYSFPFHNYFNGKLIKWCGWYPDRHIRLYNKTKTSFSTDQVHEKVLVENLQEVKLVHPVKHFSYRSTSDLLKKMESYSTLFAHQYCHKKKSSIWKAMYHSFYAFFKSYVIQRGFIGGKEGFIISLYNGQTTFYKYIKLWEKNRNATHSSLSSRRSR